MNNIQEAQLLRDNRSALVAQLNEIGFLQVNDNTPLSVIADYMKWAGGLRDLRLAVINKSTGVYTDYSEDEWNALSASAKASCVKLGIRIRADRQDFIISKDNILRSNGSLDMPWCGSLVDVKGLTNYGNGSTGHLNDIDGKTNTDLILAYGAANNIRFEAAEQARAYKACTIADGGYEDPTEWSLPAIGQVVLIYKYRLKINAAITTFFGSAYIIQDITMWSSSEADTNNAWIVNMPYGYFNQHYKLSVSRVRAVAHVPAAAE